MRKFLSVSIVASMAVSACAVDLAIGPPIAEAQDVTTPGPSRNSHSQSALEGAKSSRLRLSEGIERAEKSGEARAVEATFTPFATGGGAYDIVVLRSDGVLAQYHIDANTGSFVSVTDQKVASLLTSLTPQAVGAAKVSMTDAISLIERRSPDQRAIGASVEQDGETITYQITVATQDGDVGFHVSSNGDVSQ